MISQTSQTQRSCCHVTKGGVLPKELPEVYPQSDGNEPHKVQRKANGEGGADSDLVHFMTHSESSETARPPWPVADPAWAVQLDFPIRYAVQTKDPMSHRAG